MFMERWLDEKGFTLHILGTLFQFSLLNFAITLSSFSTTHIYTFSSRLRMQFRNLLIY